MIPFLNKDYYFFAICLFFRFVFAFLRITIKVNMPSLSCNPTNNYIPTVVHLCRSNILVGVTSECNSKTLWGHVSWLKNQSTRRLGHKSWQVQQSSLNEAYYFGKAKQINASSFSWKRSFSKRWTPTQISPFYSPLGVFTSKSSRRIRRKQNQPIKVIYLKTFFR